MTYSYTQTMTLWHMSRTTPCVTPRHIMHIQAFHDFLRPLPLQYSIYCARNRDVLRTDPGSAPRLSCALLKCSQTQTECREVVWSCIPLVSRSSGAVPPLPRCLKEASQPRTGV